MRATSVIGRCSSCRADILWLRNDKTSKLAPISLHPEPKGNVTIDARAGTYRVLSHLDLWAAQQAGTELHISHYAVCPEAAKWRNRRK